MTTISGNIAYYNNGYYYTQDGTPIHESQIEAQQTSYLGQSQPDKLDITPANEKCTDGKDDGKIGFFGAIGNAVKGAVKGIGKAVKGMFTNKEGKFSLGKTLLSVGTAALCIAVPAVGVAACAVGAVAGGVQVAKGAIAASKAETDAEAKAAWQNMGSGAATVAVSVAGAKASYGAMTSAAAKGAGSSALTGLRSSGTKLGLKTAGQYAKAFGKDAVASTRHNLKVAAGDIGTLYTKASAKLPKKATLTDKTGKKFSFSDLNNKAHAKWESVKAYGGELKTAFEKGRIPDKTTEIATATTTETSTAVTAGTKFRPLKWAKDGITNTGKAAWKGAKGAANGIKKTGEYAWKGVKGAAGTISKLPKAAQSAYHFMAKGGKFEAAVQAYGYDSTMLALETVLGSQMASNQE